MDKKECTDLGLLELLNEKINKSKKSEKISYNNWEKDNLDIDSLFEAIKHFGSAVYLENTKQFILNYLNKNINNSKININNISDMFLTGNSNIDNSLAMIKLRYIIDNPYIESKNKSFYIIDFGNEMIKIGVSSDPINRTKVIENQSGRHAVKYGYTDIISNAFLIETYFKKLLKNNKIQGEFYHVNFNFVTYVLKQHCRQELNIKFD